MQLLNQALPQQTMKFQQNTSPGVLLLHAYNLSKIQQPSKTPNQQQVTTKQLKNQYAQLEQEIQQYRFQKEAELKEKYKQLDN